VTPPGPNGPLVQLKRVAYRGDFPWYRRGWFETFGSERYSRPALHQMDVLLEKILPAGPGVFVEAGAHDGFTQSNTYYL